MYFVGNVLSPTETQPEQHDPTFSFTREEAEFDLNGIPIHMEHDDGMKVGSVMSSWNNTDGSKWIVGKIDDPGIMGSFARHAVQESSTGKRYYTGLSLTHTHTQYANGTTEKKPVEISLCVDPRRQDCRIMFVDKSDIQTRIDTYKASMKPLKMSDAKAVDTPKEIVEEVNVIEEPTATEPDATQMMEVIVKQQKDLEQLQAQAVELAKLKAVMADEKKLAFEKDVAKSEAMANALVESWSNTLDESDLTDSNREAIINMAKKFPRESNDFLRIAHSASKKFALREQKLKEAMESTKNGALKREFEAVMTKKTTHVASKKTKPKTDNDHFMKAFHTYRSGSKGTNLMEEMVKNSNKKRRRMF